MPNAKEQRLKRLEECAAQIRHLRTEYRSVIKNLDSSTGYDARKLEARQYDLEEKMGKLLGEYEQIRIENYGS